MHKLAILVACLGFILYAVAPAGAGLLVYEGFDYTSGEVVTGKTNPSNGLTWAQAGAATRVNSISVANGSLIPPPQHQPATGNSAQINGWGNVSSNGIADRLGLGSAITAGSGNTVYYSLSMRVDALTDSNNTTGGFFFGLNNSVDAQTGSPTAAAARLQARIDQTDSSKYNLGVFNNRGTGIAASTSWSDLELNVGDTIFVVASVQLNSGTGNDVSRLWINPSLSGPMPAPTAIDTVAGTDIGIASILLRQSPAPYVTLDEIRVGTEWRDVVVPEPASLGLVLVGCVLGFIQSRTR